MVYRHKAECVRVDSSELLRVIRRHGGDIERGMCGGALQDYKTLIMETWTLLESAPTVYPIFSFLHGDMHTGTV